MRLVAAYKRAVQDENGDGNFTEWGEGTNNVDEMPKRAEDATEEQSEMLFVV